MAQNDKKSVKGFVLDLSPSIEVETAIGPVYLYEIRLSDMEARSKQAQGQDAPTKFRRLLSYIGSTVKTKDGKAPRLAESQVAALTDDDVERLAQTYLGTMNNLYYAKKASAAKEPVTRREDESATSFLDRLLVWQDKDYREEMQKLWDSMLGKSANAFAEVMKQSSALSTVLDELRRAQENIARTARLSRPSDEMIVAPPPSGFDAMRRMEERRRRERDEEMELMRQIGEVSTQSASLLMKLSDAATQYIAQFAESSRKTDEGMRKGLRIAIWSLVGTVILAAVGLVVAISAYRQDAEIHRLDEKWQSEVIQTLRQQVSASDGAVRELSSQNAALRLRLEALDDKLASESAAKKKRNDTIDGSRLGKP